MLNERLYPDIKFRDKIYSIESEHKISKGNGQGRKGRKVPRIPLQQLVDDWWQEYHAEADKNKACTMKILLRGECSIGKTTSLLVLESTFLLENIPSLLIECRYLNESNLERELNIADRIPRGTVVMIDAYDELPQMLRKSFKEHIKELSERGMHLILTSRFDPYADDLYTIGTSNLDPGFESAYVRRFTDEQIRAILGSRVENVKHLTKVLANTMCFSIFLENEGEMQTETEIRNEAQFFLKYFNRLMKAKDTSTGNSENTYLGIYRTIGERVFRNFSQTSVCRQPFHIPPALNSLLQEKKEGANYRLYATQLKFLCFFAAVYIKSELEVCYHHYSNYYKKHYDESTDALSPVSALLTPIFELHGVKEIYALAGQLLCGSNDGAGIIRMLDEQFPKKKGESYSNVIGTYIGFNDGCFNCGDRSFYLGISEIDMQNFPYLYHVKIPASVVHSDLNTAFRGCDYLETMEVDEGNPKYVSIQNCIIEKAARRLVAGCTESIIPGNGEVECIADGAFRKCVNLISITIPCMVTEIPSLAFGDCRNLANVSLPSGLTCIGSLAFRGCVSLRSIYLPETVLKIEDEAFANCARLLEVTIPAKARHIGERVFEGCTDLQRISVSPNNAVYCSEGNCLIKKCNGELIAGCRSSVIPNMLVTSIGDWAFYGCTGLSDIEIPEGVCSVGEWAFSYCINLQAVTIAQSVTAIGADAFSGCSRLRRILYRGSLALFQKTFCSEMQNPFPSGATVFCVDGTLML